MESPNKQTINPPAVVFNRYAYGVACEVVIPVDVGWSKLPDSIKDLIDDTFGMCSILNSKYPGLTNTKK